MTLLADSPEVLAGNLVRALKLHLIYALSLTSDLLKTLGLWPFLPYPSLHWSEMDHPSRHFAPYALIHSICGVSEPRDRNDRMEIIPMSSVTDRRGVSPSE